MMLESVFASDWDNLKRWKITTESLLTNPAEVQLYANMLETKEKEARAAERTDIAKMYAERSSFLRSLAKRAGKGNKIEPPDKIDDSDISPGTMIMVAGVGLSVISSRSDKLDFKRKRNALEDPRTVSEFQEPGVQVNRPVRCVKCGEPELIERDLAALDRLNEGLARRPGEMKGSAPGGLPPDIYQTCVETNNAMAGTLIIMAGAGIALLLLS
eukprot:m51a1_g10612 hypothetical protein (214) ;mRNA; r:48471-49264